MPTQGAAWPPRSTKHPRRGRPRSPPAASRRSTRATRAPAPRDRRGLQRLPIVRRAWPARDECTAASFPGRRTRRRPCRRRSCERGGRRAAERQGFREPRRRVSDSRIARLQSAACPTTRTCRGSPNNRSSMRSPTPLSSSSTGRASAARRRLRSRSESASASTISTSTTTPPDAPRRPIPRGSSRGFRTERSSTRSSALRSSSFR